MYVYQICVRSVTIYMFQFGYTTVQNSVALTNCFTRRLVYEACEEFTGRLLRYTNECIPSKYITTAT